ncbi:MAG: phosphate regulon transcriptional regulator PhoB [Candidatus Thiodiazotropha sp.]|nr:phosphate regulon transcriptional regulator PhoB [Candidatus Thiodiazotropha taylori]MBT3058812.1 phosphate regulon transcriptional regulator PhoB [Candidatus Thiodiazotropha sp. (ex Lucina pensylvanica)]MBT3061558.1 phosphate regulon transcriptional regulator PhoB [Candidatus Thiodiazotropha sp. (ex Lucina pensylvanica)]PUB77127.1 MAG: phosphate regulon transcriptional regulatory protein PhoB [gamma proteobacterium symbiont of Ctena orbiculata]
MQRILIVEDEPEVREMIRYILEPKGYQVDEAGNAQEARQQLSLRNYDLILMDWMLPGRSGLDLTRELKQNVRQDSPPVIMLTARSEEVDKVNGLESGADDYITKPFSTREMLARIKAVIRRGSGTDRGKLVEFAGLSLDPGSHLVAIDGNPLHLSPAEYRLLYFFMTHPDRVYSRNQILDLVWGNTVYVDERTVDVHIRRLRKQLAPSGHDKFLQTVRGVGYRFTPTNRL